DPKTKALSKVPLFAHCSKKELDFLASRTDEVDVPAGRRLTSQGELGDSFYMLLDGEADVDVDGRFRRTLSTGDFFGEISMLDRGAPTAPLVHRTHPRLL